MDKVYDRVVLATAEYELAPEVAEQLRGDKGEKGADGVGYTDIDLQGEELVFHRTDGSDQRVPAPRGKDGEPGRDGVDGAPGKDGVSPPAPNLSVGEVSEGEAAATVTGSYPDLKINLTIPRGATGPKGDTGSAGPKGDTGNIGPRGERGETGAKGADAEPLNLAVTASTLAAGSEATASLSGDYPNLTLALGLPAGAKGDTGVGTPGPKGERGDVTVTQQGMVFGEGFPEGKVTATPGTVYTDTAVTNGAMQWIKKTGTGATGWTVTVGDTGWRDITSHFENNHQGIVSGKLLIRRTGEKVTVQTAGPLVNTGIKKQGLVRAVPGFNPRSGYWIRALVFDDSRNFALYAEGSQWRPASGALNPFENSDRWALSDTWVTSESWPSVLPGTPA